VIRTLAIARGTLSHPRSRFTRAGALRHRVLASLILVGAALGGVARADGTRELFMAELAKESPSTLRRLREFDAQLASDASAAEPALFALLGEAAQPKRGNALVWTERGEKIRRAVSLRQALLRRLADLKPAARAALAKAQGARAAGALASQAPPDDRTLCALYPLAPVAAEALRRLWARGLEAADRAGLGELSRFRRAVQPDLELRPLAPAPSRKALVDPGGKLVHTFGRVLEPGGRLGPYSPCDPLEVGGRVVVADGSRVHFFDLEGAPRGALPLVAKAASKGPDPSAVFMARPAAWGDTVFVPLLLNGPLAPGRHSLRRDDSFAGRYYSLLAVNPARGRLLWWDGDSGASGSGPPGFEGRPQLARWLRRAHVLSCVAGPRRVYVVFSVPGRDSELWVMAFVRGAGRQALELRPAWERPTYLFAAQRRQGDATDPLIAPELSAVMTLHAQGLLVSTDAGVVMNLGPRSGTIRWLARCQPGNMRQALPATPLLVREKVVHYLIDGVLHQLEAASGKRRWSGRVGAASRLLAGPAWVMAYGRERAYGLDSDGQTVFQRSLHTPDRYRCVGRIVRLGRRLLVPLHKRGPGGRLAVLQLQDGDRHWLTVQDVQLPKVQSAFNLSLTSKGVVAATARRVEFFTWR
jgi:outer membrane protein assembly factor BamB